MPVTRNRLSNQRSTAAAATASATTSTSTTASLTISSTTATSASTDGADLEERAQNNHNHADGVESPEEQLRQLRDRNSLVKPNNVQQHQNHPGIERSSTSELDGLNLSRKSKVAQPTRVLPRRTSSRPQSLLVKESPSHKSLVHDVSNGVATIANNSAKRLKHEGLSLIGPSSSASETKPSRIANRVATNKNDAETLNLKNYDVADGPNRSLDSHHDSSCHSNSLLSSLATTKSLDSHNKQHASPVSISLPSNASVSSAGIASDTLTAMQQIARRHGTISARPSDLMEDESSGAVNLSINRARSRDHQQQAPLSDQVEEKRNFNILIAVTGSVATVKLIELIKKLSSQFPQTFINKADNKAYKATISIRVLMTEHSKHFVDKNSIANCLFGTKIDVFEDADEWTLWKRMNDPVLHIELRKWADLCLIAPLDANTMAKIANGICDNLLTCTVRAWDITKKLVYCPAMNVHMYEHPITREQLCKLQSFGYMRVDCIEKRLACGDVGLGAMAHVDTIVDRVVDNLLRPIPKLNSPMKSLLNQPTYPIMSTSATPSTSQSSNPVNLMNRFRSDGLRALQGSKSSLPTARNGLSAGQSLLSAPKINNLVMARNLPQLKNINNNVSNPKKLLAPRPSIRPNLVKSLKNLKAINSNLDINFNDEILDKDDDNDDFYAEASLEPDSSEDDLNYDLDPSRLLEQSLITDDDNSFGNEPQRSGYQLNNSSSSNPSGWPGDPFQRNDSNFSPLFNTSKFLTMCYVKEKNVFNCAICKNDYKNRKSMSRHLREQHVQGNIYKCVPCDVGFKRREKLMKHNRDKHQM